MFGHSGSEQAPGSRPDTDQIQGSTIRRAIDVIDEVGRWQLTLGRWDRVNEVIGIIADAFATRDSSAFTQAVADLELLAPPRITRIGTTPATPAPAPVRDRASETVQALSQPTTLPTRPDRG